MIPGLFNKVLLKGGETAYIVAVFEPGKAYKADNDKFDSDILTDTIYQKDIEKIIHRRDIP